MSKSEYNTITIRFNKNSMEDMKAFHILQNYEKKKYKSQPKFTINAIIDYFEKHKAVLDDMSSESKENNFRILIKYVR